MGYIEAQFRTRFPHSAIIVHWNDVAEIWTVQVDDAIYLMQVGSDDDAYVFRNHAGVTITFPIE